MECIHMWSSTDCWLLVIMCGPHIASTDNVRSSYMGHIWSYMVYAWSCMEHRMITCSVHGHSRCTCDHVWTIPDHICASTTSAWHHLHQPQVLTTMIKYGSRQYCQGWELSNRRRQLEQLDGQFQKLSNTGLNIRQIAKLHESWPKVMYINVKEPL